MFNPDELAAFKQNIDAFKASQKKTQPTATTKKGGRGGFLTSLISEGGALGGGAAGAAAGTAILPGIGTLLGGAIGSGIGAFGGRIAENKVRDNRIGLGDAAKEGALSAVLGGGPIRLAKAGIGAAVAKKGGASLTDALMQAGEKAGQNTIRKTVGNKLADASNDLVIKDFRLKPSQLTNFKKKFGEDASQVIKRYNLTGKDSEAIRQTVIQPLQQEFDTIASQIPAIPTKTIQKAFEAKYSKLLSSAVEDNKAVGRQLKDQADTIVKKYGETIDGNEVGALRREFDDLVSYADKAANPARYNVNKRSADALRSVLQDTADKVGLTSTEGKSFKEVGKELSKLHQLTDNIQSQEGLGRGSLPLGLTNLLGGGLGGSLGPAGALGGIVTTQALNSPTGRKLMAKGAGKVAEKLTQSTSNPYSLGGIASRILPAAAISAGVGGAQDSRLFGQSTASPMASNTSNEPPINANIPSSYQENTSLSSSSPFAPQNLETAIQQILQNGGSLDDADKFVSLAETLQKLRNPAGDKKLNATQMQQANNAQSGLDSLNTIQSILQQNPNTAKLASLPGGSFTQSLTGTGEYSAAIANATDVIGRLRSGGAINADEEKRFRSLLPGTFDDPNTVRYKLQTLSSLFNRFINPNAASNDPTDLASALLAAQ